VILRALRGSRLFLAAQTLRRRSPSKMTAGTKHRPPTSASATPSEVTRPISASGAKLEAISAPNPTIVVRFD